MSKKLFLAAASVAALAFGGAAQADVISGTIGAGGFDKDGAYLIASERVVSEAKPLSGSITVSNKLKTAIELTDGASRDYLVSFTLTGAEVGATSLVADPAVLAADGSVGASLVSSDGGVVTYLVTVRALAGKTVKVTHFALTAAVEQEAQANIVVSGNVIALVGGSQIPFDTAKAVTAVSYAPFFSSLTPTVVNATAALNDYIKFLDGAGPATTLSATLGSVVGLSKAAADGKIHTSLTGVVAGATDLLDDDGVVTVTGPLITSDFVATLNDAGGLVGVRGTAAQANTAVFKLDADEAEDFLKGLVSLKLEQTNVLTKQAEIQAGSYTVSWAPKALAAFAVPSSSAVVGSVSLQGSNFYAPWVSGTGLASSVVRLSNNTNKVSGAVTVRLRNATKVTAGVSAPFVTTAAPLVLAGVPGGSDMQITSAELVAHFGEFTRGDLQITVNSADGAVTAKMRSTRDGQTFEQSLAAK